MERIKELNRYQQGILILLVVMIIVFGVIYSVVSSRVGYSYLDIIFLPSEENGNTVYSGTIRGKESRFVVTPEKAVTFLHGEKVYGPYTAMKKRKWIWIGLAVILVVSVILLSNPQVRTNLFVRL